jgi:Mrp family chromosome partitioning ATPase
MGKMLESLLKLNGRHGVVVESKPPPVPDNNPDAVETPSEPLEDFLFIEVGAPGKKIDGSPVVLAATAAPGKIPAAPKNDKPKLETVEQTLVPTLAEPRPAGVVLQAMPAASNKKPAREIIAYHQPEHPIAKQYGELFAHMRSNLDDEAGVIVLAGAAPQTGTTTVVLNLAFAGAIAGPQRTIVVEGNLLRPALAQRLGVEKSAGLLDVLAGVAALDKTPIATLQPRLHALLAGNQKALTRKATPEAIAWILGWLRERYEIVLVDAPDLSEPQEVETLAVAADALYIVVPHDEHGAARYSSLSQAIARRGGRLRGLIHTHFENM